MHTVVSVEKINAGKLHLCDAVKLKDQLHLGYFRKKKKKVCSFNLDFSHRSKHNTELINDSQTFPKWFVKSETVTLSLAVRSSVFFCV